MTYVIAPCSSSDYITKGKKYLVIEQNSGHFIIINDRGTTSLCLWKGCAHLRGYNWIIAKKKSKFGEWINEISSQ